jgi:hypothetical protein
MKFVIMLELIWGILNISIFIYFIIICFKAVKIVRENLGGISTLILVIGLMSFIVKPNNETNKIKTFNIKDNSMVKGEEKIDGHVFNEEIILEEKFATTVIASISFKEYDQQIRLLKTYTMMTGFVSGIDWKASRVDITKNIDSSYNYEVIGTKDWSILGIKVYTQSNVFKGKIKL